MQAVRCEMQCVNQGSPVRPAGKIDQRRFMRGIDPRNYENSEVGHFATCKLEDQRSY
jgi:hypothetical protein